VYLFVRRVSARGSVIPVGTTVLSVTGTTVMLSANVTGAGVANGDTVGFTVFSAAAGSSPSSVANNAPITFPTATASWGTVIAIGLYDAPTGGNLLLWDYLGSYPWQPATFSSASPGVLTAKAHGFAAADPIVFSTEYGGMAPTFSASNLTNRRAPGREPHGRHLHHDQRVDRGEHLVDRFGLGSQDHATVDPDRRDLFVCRRHADRDGSVTTPSLTAEPPPWPRRSYSFGLGSSRHRGRSLPIVVPRSGQLHWRGRRRGRWLQ